MSVAEYNAIVAPSNMEPLCLCLDTDNRLISIRYALLRKVELGSVNKLQVIEIPAGFLVLFYEYNLRHTSFVVSSNVAFYHMVSLPIQVVFSTMQENKYAGYYTMCTMHNGKPCSQTGDYVMVHVDGSLQFSKTLSQGIANFGVCYTKDENLFFWQPAMNISKELLPKGYRDNENCMIIERRNISSLGDEPSRQFLLQHGNVQKLCRNFWSYFINN